jgi:hypothetical protein
MQQETTRENSIEKKLPTFLPFLISNLPKTGRFLLGRQARPIFTATVSFRLSLCCLSSF